MYDKMSFLNRVDIPHHLKKTTELRGISDSLYSIRKTLESLHHKGLKTTHSDIGTQLFKQSSCLGNCKNDETQYHYYHSMDSTLKKLEHEISTLQSLYRKLYEAKPNYAYSIPETRIEPITTYTPPQSQGISRVVIVPREERSQVRAFLITSHNYVLGILGSHSALYIHIEGEEPFLYDPNGSYLMGRRGSGAFFMAHEANLRKFVKYHIDDGDHVTTRPLTLSKEQAKKIIEKAMIQGEEGSLSCALNVSAVLLDEYGLDDVYRYPRELDKVIKQQEEKGRNK